VNGTPYGEYERRPGESGFHLLNRLLIVVIIIALCVAGVIAFSPIFSQYRAQNERIRSLRKEVAAQTVLNKRREHEVQLLQNDPTYLETVARDRLDVMKPGETIIHLDPPKPAAPAVAPAKR